MRPLPPAGLDRKIGLTIFGDKELEGATMFRAGRSQSFKELMFRGEKIGFERQIAGAHHMQWGTVWGDSIVFANEAK